VEALIEEKAQGKTIATPKSTRPNKVVDLMEALSASIKASEAKSSPRAKNSRDSAKRAPANAAATKATSKTRTASPSRRKAS
jgi:non-homologous end joining protein Ku